MKLQNWPFVHTGVMIKPIIGIVSYFMFCLPRPTKLMRLSNDFWVVYNPSRKTCFPQQNCSSLCNMSSLRYLNGDPVSWWGALPVKALPIGQHTSYCTIQITLRASLSHVAQHTGHNFWKEYILSFLKTPPFKNLKNKQLVFCFHVYFITFIKGDHKA